MTELKFTNRRKKHIDIIMDIEKEFPEQYRLARRFHELYELVAPLFNYETKRDTKKFIPESPNGRTMAYVCYKIVQEELKSWKKKRKREFMGWKKKKA